MGGFKKYWLLVLVSGFLFAGQTGYAQLQRLTLEEAGLSLGGKLDPSLRVYDTAQHLVPIRQVLTGHYSVIVTGCLTCPVFYRTYPKVEAIAKDYSPKGVQFYFLYKLLAHPENHGYVKAFTIDERFLQVKRAQEKLETSIPWLTDPMTNEVSRAFAMASNAEVLFDPQGRIVYMSQWSNDSTLRLALENIFGLVEPATIPESLHLPKLIGIDSLVEGVVPRIHVKEQLITLKVKPRMEDGTFYAKLRAEADDSLFFQGSGHLFLGFRLDPLHHVHWNNLAEPLTFSIDVPDGTTVSPSNASSPRILQPSDIDPREFFIHVKHWDKSVMLPLTVDYYACDADDKWCIPVTQHYLIELVADPFGGRVYDRSFR